MTHIISLQQSELNDRLATRCYDLGYAYVTLTPFSIHFHPWQETLTAATISAQDWLIFLSPNAVKGFADGWRGEWPSALIAIGHGTQKAIGHYTSNPVLIPSVSSSEGLLTLPVLQTLNQQHIMLVKGVGGRSLLTSALTARGATVRSLLCYERQRQSINIAPLLKIWQNGEQAVLLATSFAALELSIEQLPAGLMTWFLQQPLIVTSQRLVALASKQGFSQPALSTHLTEADILAAIRRVTGGK